MVHPVAVYLCAHDLGRAVQDVIHGGWGIPQGADVFIPVKGCLGYFNWREHLTDDVPAPAKWMLPKQPKPEPQGSLL